MIALILIFVVTLLFIVAKVAYIAGQAKGFSRGYLAGKEAASYTYSHKHETESF